MKLHLDKAAFQLVVDDISKKCSVRRDVLEKDYYVTLLLKELSEKEHQAYAYFKGGTALYKALKSIRRFSEDIDLTVYIEDCPTASQAKKRLENATLKFSCLEKGETLENHRGSICPVSAETISKSVTIRKLFFPNTTCSLSQSTTTWTAKFKRITISRRSET